MMRIAKALAGWLFHQHDWRVKRRGRHRFIRCEKCKAEKWIKEDAHV